MKYLLGTAGFFFSAKASKRSRKLCAIVLIVGWFSLAPFTVFSTTTSRRKPTELSRLVKSQTYLALGDSTGLGVGAKNGYGYVEQLMSLIQKEHPGSRLVKLCRLGETATSLRQRIADGFPVRPTFVTLSIGINDVLQGISEEQFAENYEEIVKSLKRLAVPIVVTNLPSISSAPSLPDSMRERTSVKILLFNKRIEDLAERYDLLFVNLYQASHGLIIKDTRFFSSDGFHPSDAGYKFWMQVMWPTVKLAINSISKTGNRSVRGAATVARLRGGRAAIHSAPANCNARSSIVIPFFGRKSRYGSPIAKNGSSSSSNSKINPARFS